MDALAGYNSESEDDTSVDETKKELLSVESLKTKINLNMVPFVEKKKVGNRYCSFDSDSIQSHIKYYFEVYCVFYGNILVSRIAIFRSLNN